MSRVTIYGPSIETIVENVSNEIQHQMAGRSYRAANELRNSALTVLRGQRSGRMYGSHQASAPGEPPAVKTGQFRISWEPSTFAFGNSYISRISNPKFYAGWLENGTPGGQMAPRPHHDLIAKHAEPSIVRIYDEPYF